MTGVVHVKDGSTWKCLNFNSQTIWVKDAGTWKEPTGVFVNHSGTWKKVYPSDLEAWTTANLPTNAEQDTSGTHLPTLATANEYLNLLVADADVTWDDGNDSTPSAYVRGWDFNWSPLSSAGFGYGAVSRVEVSLQARYHNTPGGGVTYSLDVGPQKTTLKNTGSITGSLTTYTLDYTVAGWGLTDSNAGQLHTSPDTTDSIEVSPDYSTASPSATAYIHIEDLKCRVKYWYN